jgi:hypothetical protein
VLVQAPRAPAAAVGDEVVHLVAAGAVELDVQHVPSAIAGVPDEHEAILDPSRERLEQLPAGQVDIVVKSRILRTERLAGEAETERRQRVARRGELICPSMQRAGGCDDDLALAVAGELELGVGDLDSFAERHLFWTFCCRDG